MRVQRGNTLVHKLAEAGGHRALEQLAGVKQKGLFKYLNHVNNVRARACMRLRGRTLTALGAQFGQTATMLAARERQWLILEYLVAEGGDFLYKVGPLLPTESTFLARYLRHVAQGPNDAFPSVWESVQVRGVCARRQAHSSSRACAQNNTTGEQALRRGIAQQRLTVPLVRIPRSDCARVRLARSRLIGFRPGAVAAAKERSAASHLLQRGQSGRPRTRAIVGYARRARAARMRVLRPSPLTSRRAPQWRTVASRCTAVTRKATLCSTSLQTTD